MPRTKAQIAEYQKLYRLKHSEDLKEKQRERYEADRERILARNRDYSSRNKEKIQASVKARYARDPNFRIAHSIRCRIGALTKGLKRLGSKDLLGCTIEELRKHLSDQFTEGMTWDNYGEWHLDHIRPLASFDLTDPAQLAQAAHYTNLQPLWELDNLIKGAKYE